MQGNIARLLSLVYLGQVTPNMRVILLSVVLYLFTACHKQYVCPSYDQSKVRSAEDVMNNYDKRK